MAAEVAPVFRVRVAANRPNAQLAIRLCEVDPQGRSWLVTYGVLNLTHRESHEHPEALEPGYRPGPYSPDAEALTLRFVDWYCRNATDYLNQVKARARVAA